MLELSFIILFAIITIYGIVVSVSFYRDHKKTKKNDSDDRKTNEEKDIKYISKIKMHFKGIQTVYQCTLICSISFLAAYDLYGDIYFLSTIHKRAGRLQIIMNCYNGGLVQCNNNDPLLCLPMEKQPTPPPQNLTMYLNSTSLWSPYAYSIIDNWSNRGYESYDRQCFLPYLWIPGGYSCNDVYSDTSIYSHAIVDKYTCISNTETDVCPISYQIYSNFQKCVLSVCNQCMDSCDNQYGMNFDQGGHMYVFKQDIVDSEARYFISCNEWSVRNVYPTLYIYCVVILWIIISKEIIKMLIILGYFFSTMVQKPILLKLSINSPLTAFFMLVSDRYKTDALAIKQNKLRRTLGLLLDLVFENIPQITLAMWCVINLPGANQTPTYISLSGSLIMTLKSVYILVSYLCADYNEVKSNTTQATATAITMSTKNESFKEWFYKNVKLDQESMDQYFAIFVDQGIDSFDLVKDLSANELENIGVTKLGHRKLILKAIQSH